MRMMRAAAFAGLVLTLTACSGSGSDDGSDAEAGSGSADDAVASQAISDSIMEEQQGSTDGIFAMERREADCIGDGFVEEIGVEQLQAYGFLSEDMKAEPMTNVTMETKDAEAATDTLFACADVPALMSEALASGEQLDKRTRACIDDVLTDQKLRSMFTLMFSGKQDEANQEVIAPMMQCAPGTTGE